MGCGLVATKPGVFGRYATSPLATSYDAYGIPSPNRIEPMFKIKPANPPLPVLSLR